MNTSAVYIGSLCLALVRATVLLAVGLVPAHGYWWGSPPGQQVLPDGVS
jgi:hypothetical protein